MTPERWQKVKKVLAAALERGPAERSAYLDQVCAEPLLRREVESLIAAHEQGDSSFIEQPAVESDALKSGTKLGPYEIFALVGAGGMGEVYQAHDTKLGRNVAIKVLPTAFVHDPERLSRFQREARMLAALNHPNIATIYGLEQSDGVHYLVMELVPGETLAERIGKGALPLREALKVAGQVTEALEAAHEKGVIHRDLKPANVKVTPQGRVKVLDFGLAKAFSGDGGLDLSHAPTLTAMGTEEGRILGTPAYMSPEQARGKPVDKRTDIWAFGCVLYELLTGERAFRGETTQDTIAAVLEYDPDWKALPPLTPAKICDLLRRCLHKDPQRRLRDLGDARIEIEETLTPPAAAGQTRQHDAVLADGTVPTSGRRLPRARRRTEGPGRDLSAARREARWISVVVLTILVAALFGFNVGGWRERLLSRNRPSRISSLAVLPLENFSRDPDQEYFADGMTEALIADLSKISALRVISRTSAMHYKGTHMTLPDIARELKVDGIVEGSVQQNGTHVRITAQLIGASNDKLLWSKSYERDLKDLLALQDDVARAVAGEIRVNLTPNEQARLLNARPVNPEAQEAYLRGWFLWEQKGVVELKKEFEYYQLAIEKDPDYAPAYAELGETCGMMASVGLMPRDEADQKWKAAAQKAIELDDTLAEAHSSLASLREYEDWDWSGAEKEFKRAIELNPSFADAHKGYADDLAQMGRMDEAVAEIERFRELDPISHNVSAAVASVLYYARHYARAIAEASRGLELEPDSPLPHEVLGLVYEQQGQLDRAITEFQKARAFSKVLANAAGRLAELGHAYAASGKIEEARRILEEMQHGSQQSSFNFALVYVGLGDKDQTFHWLNRGFDERPDGLPNIKVDPRFEGLHSDPRFQALLHRMGLPL